ncbi:hypothetical protein DL96DRAFT_504106 [Flagelloscypha sp. PMI_526]|nr:hypothetical protein DL96DRAFT_504106 [Flagelloscypha sp. PMI_526]
MPERCGSPLYTLERNVHCCSAFQAVSSIQVFNISLNACTFLELKAMPASTPYPSPETGLRLLAFDGGGLRAISQALIVRDMCRRLEEDHQLEQPARVSDYFDMICGSGLGGLLAIMCGILCMTGEQLVEEFLHLCKAAFSGDLDIEQRTLRYEEEMKRIIAKFSGGIEGRRMFGGHDTCKTFVCAAPAHNTSHPRLFRNYRSRTNASPDCTLLEAARATTAMPGLFSPISIGPEYIGEVFVSGELGWNNPTDELTEEATLMFTGRSLACIINIGSGHSGHLSLSNGLSDLFTRIALDCERTVEKMERRFGKVHGVYRRLNVEQGMQNLDVDLTNLHEVVSHANSYLQGYRVTRNVDGLLQDLTLRPARVRADMISGVLLSTPDVLHYKVCPPPTPHFTGRRVELQTLEEHFTSQTNACRVGVLYGIGGGGKTQIGLEFIQRCRDRFSEIFFVDASDKLTLENSLKAIAGASLDTPSVDDALRLLRTRHDNWLLFLDNADEPILDLRPYVSWSHGNVLITTRNREVRSHAPKCSIWVDRLESEDAKELLLRGVNVDESFKTHELALKIVHELGYLALAINQARAFLVNGLCALDEYLPLYARNRKKLLEDKTFQTTDEYQYSVYTTWTISFNKLSHDAALLLELLSHMHHESIPSRLFEDAWKAVDRENEEAVSQNLRTFLSSFTAIDSAWDVLRFRKLLQEILSFSLLEFDITNHSISLHPLVQQWAQHQCQHHVEIVPATQTLLCLAAPQKWSSRDYAMRVSLLPHLRESLKDGIELHYTFLIRAGFVYEHGGMLRESVKVWERAVSDTQQRLGSEHMDTLVCMGGLASAYLSLGRTCDALELNMEVLKVEKRVLGNEHPDTLSAMSDLSLIYEKLGQYQDALKLNQEVFEMMKRVLGYEHPSTLATTSNLACVYQRLGQYQDALKLNQEVLEVKKRVLSYEHPDTLATMSNLASVYESLGLYRDALRLNQEVFEMTKRVLGDEHPSTLATMSNLASVYQRLGQYQDALKLDQEVLEVKKRVLSYEHPSTLAAMSNLASVYEDLGLYQDALRLNQEVFDMTKRVLGDEHPSTLATMSNLASVYQRLGQYQDALKLNQEVLEVKKRVLRDEHPNTLATMGNLAMVYNGLGQYQDALKLNEKVFEVRKRVLGDEHPDTLLIMFNLAHDYVMCGRHQDALELHKHVFELRSRVLGPEHPYTIASSEWVKHLSAEQQVQTKPKKSRKRDKVKGLVNSFLK